jgi:RNA recognition motif-containing protein
MSTISQGSPRLEKHLLKTHSYPPRLPLTGSLFGLGYNGPRLGQLLKSYEGPDRNGHWPDHVDYTPPRSPAPETEGDSAASDTNTNLIVRNLPAVTTEEDLQTIFGPCGPIDSAKIMYDPVSGLHKGFGFVKFLSNKAAAKAIETLNGFTVNNQAIIVELARSSFKGAGGEQGTPSEKVFVKNLPLSWGDSEVADAFSPLGTISDIKVLPDGTGTGSRGQAIITFSSVEEASLAIASLHGYQIPTTPNRLLLRYAHTDQEKVRSTSQGNLIPSNPAPSPVTSPGTRRRNPAAAVAPPAPQPGPPIQELRNSQDSPTQLSAPPSPTESNAPQPDPQPPINLPLQQDANIYISNLPDDADDALLHRIFGPFGPVVSVAIRKNPQGKIGFCRMSRVEDAWAGIQALNGTRIRPEDPKTLFVQFKKEKKRH